MQFPRKSNERATSRQSRGHQLVPNKHRISVLHLKAFIQDYEKQQVKNNFKTLAGTIYAAVGCLESAEVLSLALRLLDPFR